MKNQSVTQALEALRREHNRIVVQLHRDHESLRSIANTAWKAQEAERQRLARELHDGVGQTLSALKNELSILIRERISDEAADRAERALELCATCIADIRELSRLLYPPALADLGLQAALEQLIRIVNGQGSLSVELIVDGDLGRLPQDCATFLYRTCQEALTNASKYAAGANALIRIRVKRNECTMLVMDDGPGFDVRSSSQSGFGLQAMRERASLFGAVLIVESAVGEGTRIRARLKLDAITD